MASADSTTVEFDADTHQQITLLARAWGIAPQDVFRLLLAHFARTRTAQDEAHQAQAMPTGPSAIPVYAVYAGTRIEALYDPATASVTIPHGPGEGIKSPSGASAAVLRALRPGIAPNRTGWSFWRIASSGQPLSTLRTMARINPVPVAPPAPPPPRLPSGPRP
ncbi:hypothetical protein AB0D86_44040 [Streptomyces sp. NPDC048324]|uniref:hypothetical protein n=1 Tax=Streptomyces sp. NPDC048324 TaxID=3157205 RepID=UPI00342C9E41